MSIRLPLGSFFGINTTDGLKRCRGDHSFYWSLLLAFLDEHGSSAGKLAAYLSGGNRVEAEALAHTLKGTAGLLGLEDIQKAAGLLDRDLKAALETGRFPETVVEDMEQVRLELERFDDGMTAFANRMEEP